jgi:hypothetical protein
MAVFLNELRVHAFIILKRTWRGFNVTKHSV